MGNKLKSADFPAGPDFLKTVCISGKLPSGRKKADYIEPLLAVGIDLVDDVFDGLTYLVLAAPSAKTAKSDKAAKLGVQVISEDELMYLVEGGTAAVSNPELEVATQFEAIEGDHPPAFKKLMDIYDAICVALDTEPPEDRGVASERVSLLRELRQGFESGTWCWEPQTTAMADDRIDRLGEVIMGPIYTCEEYPWPVHDGFPMTPLIQLDLRKVSEIGSVPLGDGLLQVWMPHKAISTPQFIRVVPRLAVDPVNLTAIVEIPDAAHPLQRRGEDWSYELNKFIPARAIQITGYSPKRFTMQMEHLIQENYKIEHLTDCRETALLFKEFDKRLKPLLKRGAKGYDPATCHLFGTFSKIQYSANERPPPLFCFESDELGLMWGDGGNAQLFYKLDSNGQPTFSFDWSCT